jgi:hypothetical protein
LGTLGDASGFRGTLLGGAGGLGGTLGGAVGVVLLSCGVIFDEKISDRCSSVLSVFVSMGANGPAGWGWLSASVNRMAALMDVLLDDSVGILPC